MQYFLKCNIKIGCANSRRIHGVGENEGYLQLSASAGLPRPRPAWSYVIKNLQGESKHNSLILDDKNSMSVLSTLNSKSCLNNGIPILEKKRVQFGEGMRKLGLISQLGRQAAPPWRGQGPYYYSWISSYDL